MEFLTYAFEPITDFLKYAENSTSLFHMLIYSEWNHCEWKFKTVLISYVYES